MNENLFSDIFSKQEWVTMNKSLSATPGLHNNEGSNGFLGQFTGKRLSF